MNWRVLCTQESEAWYTALKHLPQADIYFLPEYHQVHELNGDGLAQAFVAEEGDEILFYPFFVRPIKQKEAKPTSTGWYDIETAYGYSGPLCTTTDDTFLSKAWNVFSAWCRENRIVAEFTRFNPLLKNQQYAGAAWPVKLDRQIVAVPLDCSKNELWDNYPSVQRNMVRKALKKELVCQEVSLDEGLPVFRHLYNQTMDRIEAQDYYYFSEAYFRHMSKALAEKLVLFTVQEKHQKTIAAALFLWYDKKIHYHLAGSDADYREVAPTNLLLHTVAQWGQERGFHWLNLGGGRTPLPDDSLFHFKASISRLRLPFYTGKRIHDPVVYEALCAEWLQAKAKVERPNYFLLYRLS